MHVRVLIAGGGPAGCAAALTLRRWLPEIPVVLLERPASGGCTPSLGESLPPGIVPLLDYLGLKEQFLAANHLPACGTSSAWGDDQPLHRPYLFSAMGHGWQIDRGLFDTWLREQAEASGALLLRANVIGVTRLDQGVRLQLGDASLTTSITADVVIDASGRSARLARALGAKVTAADELTAVARWYTVPGDAARSSDGALIASLPEGWWYAALLPNGQGVLALMSDAATFRRESNDIDRFWHRCCEDSPAIFERVRRWRPTGSRQTRRAGSQHTEPVVGASWVAAGDAAAAFDPLASLGIGFAISSGIAAARVAAAHLDDDPAPGADYIRAVRTTVADYQRRLSSFYAMEHRWDSGFWRTRQQPDTARSESRGASLARSPNFVSRIE
jgi:flavin-dependent dehydrogenase